MSILRIFGSAVIAGLVPLIFWFGGFEFHRGYMAAICCIFTAHIFFGAITAPFWPEWTDE